MTWNTEKINHLSNEILEGKTLKSLLRDISIDSILDSESSDLSFPFYLPYKMNDVDTDLKAANIPFEFTKKEIENYYKYLYNPIELYKVMNIDLFSYEEALINNYYNNRFNLTILPQGMKLPNLLAFFVLHYITFNKDKTILIIDEHLNDIRNLLINHYRSIPFYLKPGIVKQAIIYDPKKSGPNGAKFELRFDNGSRIISTGYNSSYKSDFILITNLDKNEDVPKLIDLIPLLSMNDSKMMILTTQNNLFNSNYFSIFERLDIKDYFREENLNRLI